MTPKEQYQNLSLQASGYFECQLPVLTQSEKAVCFDAYTGYLNHNRPVWIPKSQMQILDLGKEAGVRYFIKNWLSSKL